MKLIGDIGVIGNGSPEGGEETIVIFHPCWGCTVITIWGYDYGGGVHKVYELDEENHQLLLKKVKDNQTEEVIREWLESDMKSFEILGET